MLYDEYLNRYLKSKEVSRNCLSQMNMFYVKEFGEYISINLNIKSLSQFEFKGYVFMLVLDGSGIVTIGEDVIPLCFGDLFIFNGDKPHIISNNLWKICYIVVEGENLYKILNQALNNKHLFHLSNVDEIYRNYKLIYETMSEDLTSTLQTCSYVFQLLSNILKYGKCEKLKGNFETRIYSYIENNYMKDISIEEMANLLGYSKYSFIRKFKEIFDITPYQYLVNKRITYAKYLLTMEDLTIEQISNQVGFHSISNFCVSFKQNEGISPKMYRKKVNCGRRIVHEKESTNAINRSAKSILGKKITRIYD